MRFLRFASGLALAVTMNAGAANAVTLAEAAQPAERPPAGYSGDVYVDSRGCAYVRATIGSAVNWVPRLASDRKTVICGLTPTSQVAGLASGRLPAPPTPPVPTAITPAGAPTVTAAVRAPTAPAAVATSTPAPASTVVSNSVSRTIAVTCPSDGSKARVRVGADTIAIQCAPGMTLSKSYIVRHPDGERTRLVVKPPVAQPQVITVADTGSPTAGTVRAGDVLYGGRVRIGNTPMTGDRGTFGSGYGTSNYPGPLDPVPSPGAGAVLPRATPNAPGSRSVTSDRGRGYDLAPVPDAGRVTIPEGYKPAWDDDRLNPDRGPRTAYGDSQMAATLTADKVPMRSVTSAPLARSAGPARSPSAAPAAVTTSAAPAKRYVQVGMFNVPSNATRAAAKLQSLGLPGRVASTASGKRVVIAGPYDSVAALNSALATARRGFPDAFLRN